MENIVERMRQNDIKVDRSRRRIQDHYVSGDPQKSDAGHAIGWRGCFIEANRPIGWCWPRHESISSRGQLEDARRPACGSTTKKVDLGTSQRYSGELRTQVESEPAGHPNTQLQVQSLVRIARSLSRPPLILQRSIADVSTPRSGQRIRRHARCGEHGRSRTGTTSSATRAGS